MYKWLCKGGFFMKKISIYAVLLVMNFSAVQSSMMNDDAVASKVTFQLDSPLDVVLNNPVFKELRQLHTEFKREKEELGELLKDNQINKKEFDEKFELARKKFENKTQDLKKKYSYYPLRSVLATQVLIAKLRNVQRDEEFPLKKKYLLTEQTYDRQQFEKERLEIERKHEAIRSFLTTFTKEPETEQEAQAVQDLQNLQKKYKKDVYEIKQELLPVGQQSYQQEIKFQEANERLLAQHQQRQQEMFNQLQQAQSSKKQLKVDHQQKLADEMVKEFQGLEQQHAVALVTNDQRVVSQDENPFKKMIQQMAHASEKAINQAAATSESLQRARELLGRGSKI